MLLQALTKNPNLDIAVAAPTGKAAKKLKDTIQAGIAISRLGFFVSACKSI
jgi:exodeoxyribonuclease V alpha subunit